MSLAHQVQRFNRDRKWERFNNEFPPHSLLRILDVGYTDREFSPLDNYLEKNYPYPEMITALGIDPPKYFNARYPKVHAMTYDGWTIPFPDRTFDVCWSNAVIEHVGDRKTQLRFVQELLRVSKGVFFTTPNRHFPIEVHTHTLFIHYFPKSLFDRYLKLVGKGWASGEYMHLLSRSDLSALIKSAGENNARLYKNRLLGFTLDFVVVIKNE